VDDAGTVDCVTETQNYIDVWEKPQVEGYDLATQQIWLDVSQLLPATFSESYISRMYSAPLARYAAISDSWIANNEKVCPF
jgi:hypothetical protein